MNARINSKSTLARGLRHTLVFHMLLGPLAADAAPPAWWTAGGSPVVDATNSNPDKNHAMANIGQAKWMVEKALQALETEAPLIAAQIRSDLQGRGPSDPNPTAQIVDLTVPTTKTAGWIEKQKAPLLLGELKALAAPFYKRLSYSAAPWLDNETTVEAKKGQLQLNGTKEPAPTGAANFYPWTSTTSDDANKQPATIGQLKSVFSLRFDTLEGVSPYIIRRGAVTSGYSQSWGRFTLAGQTLTAERGTWNTALGFEVTGYWFDVVTNTKVGADNVLSYTVTAADATAGAILVWRETATHGGVTESLDFGRVPVQPLEYAVPEPLGESNIVGSHAPGATLTRTTDNPAGIIWRDPFEGLQGHESLRPISVVGGWYKNDVYTGVTSTTYSGSTLDGDIMEYRETATNGVGASTTEFLRFAVSAAVAAYQNEKQSQISPLTAGKAGGAANMDVYSSVNHAYTPPGATDSVGAYTRNTNLWAAPLVSQLTGAVALKDPLWIESHGGILITPRHVLYCEHGHPHAKGTWINDTPPLKLRFVLENNTVIEAVQLCQSDQQLQNSTKPNYISSASLGAGLGALVDLCVAVLDRDVEALGAHVMKIPRMRSPEEFAALSEFSSPFFALSQGFGQVKPYTPPTPVSNYPQEHKSMLYIKNNGGGLATAPYENFGYGIWKGDSGTPQFMLHRGEIYLQDIISGSPPPLHIAQINQLIGAADAGAVAMGRLETVTGLTVTPKVLPSD